jgi:20S proteasome alpha/beta subunit
MTCIVALTHKGKIYIGGERGNSDEHIIVPALNPKVFEIGSYVLGYSGNTGIGQSVAYGFDFPPPPKNNSITKHMISSLVPALRSYLKDIIPEKEEEHAGLIVGLKGHIYEIDTTDFQCVEYEEIAIGSGSPYAYGSLYSNKDYEPMDRIRQGIEAAILYSPTCIGPIDIIVK